MIDEKMIVFAPHPDDETLALGGTIIRRLQEGSNVHIVLMTDGRHSHDLILGMNEPSPEQIARIRTAEFKEATMILGVNPENKLLLGFEDTKLGQHVTEAKKIVVEVLLKISPSEVYVPYRSDGTEDHRATYEIVRDSITRTNTHPRIFEYPVWDGKIPQHGLKIQTVDVSRELAKKKEAVSKYKSQISKCFPKQKKAVLSKDFVKMFCSEIETFYTEE